MKKALLFGLSLALLLMLCAAPVSAEEPDWVAAYTQLLDDWALRLAGEPVEFGVSPELWYLAYDIDKDGAPELLVKTGTCEADYHGALYTFRDGRALQLGEELGLGHSSFYSDPGENGLILMYGHMGYAMAVRLSLRDGYAEELLYEDDLNARLQSDPDAEYVYPGDVIPGAAYLTLCRADVKLALTQYEAISRCLEGALPAQTACTYPNGDAAFFDTLMQTNGEVYAATADGYTHSPGRIGFREMLWQDTAADWMAGDLSILSAATADLNGDGQLECVLAASDGAREMRLVLSEQDGQVYAYLMNYTDGYELDADGCFRTTLYGTSRYRLFFDRQQAFLLTLPD